MNYRHIYHAGNFADAFKHILLIALTQSFLKKPTPFCYIDTHAGTGLYDLQSSPAQVNQEFAAGVGKIKLAKHPPELVQTYLDCIQQINPDESLHFYPGSPSFVRLFLRPDDQMILSELHPEDFQALKKYFAHHKQVAVHKQNGYQSLSAFLPPKQRRGFVLIDPPYEKSDESNQLMIGLTEGLRRWPTGTYAIWYPIKSRKTADAWLKQIKHTFNASYLIAELSIYPEDTEQHLNGNGLLIVNPPWQLKEEIENILPWLWETLSINHQGKYVIEQFGT